MFFVDGVHADGRFVFVVDDRGLVPLIRINATFCRPFLRHRTRTRCRRLSFLSISQMSHIQEHVLKRRYGDSILHDLEFFHLRVKIVKELLELRCVVQWDLHDDFGLNFRKLFGPRSQILLEILLKLNIWRRGRLDHVKRVADTELALQEERGPKTGDFSLRHDADSVAKNVCFVHIVGRQQHNPVFLVLFQAVPDLPPRIQI